LNYNELTFEQLLDEYFYLKNLLKNTTKVTIEEEFKEIYKQLDKFKFVRKVD